MQPITIFIWIAIISIALILTIPSKNRYVRNEYLAFIKGKTHEQATMFKFSNPIRLSSSNLSDNIYWVYFSSILFGTIFILCWFIPLNITFILAGINSMVLMHLILESKVSSNRLSVVTDLIRYMENLEDGLSKNKDIQVIFMELLNSGTLKSSFKNDLKDMAIALKNGVSVTECTHALNLKYSYVPYFVTSNDLLVQAIQGKNTFKISNYLVELSNAIILHEHKVNVYKKYSYALLSTILLFGVAFLIAIKLDLFNLTSNSIASIFVVVLLSLCSWKIIREQNIFNELDYAHEIRLNKKRSSTNSVNNKPSLKNKLFIVNNTLSQKTYIIHKLLTGTLFGIILAWVVQLVLNVPFSLLTALITTTVYFAYSFVLLNVEYNKKWLITKYILLQKTEEHNITIKHPKSTNERLEIGNLLNYIKKMDLKELMYQTLILEKPITNKDHLGHIITDKKDTLLNLYKWKYKKSLLSNAITLTLFISFILVMTNFQ